MIWKTQLKERKSFYILLIILIIFCIFRCISWVVDGVLKQKYELSLKKETLVELQAALEEYDSLEFKKLNYEKLYTNLKEKFYLQAENAANIIAYGEEHGVYIKSITPLEEIISDYYYEIPFQIDFNCNYKAFKNFIRELEEYPASAIFGIDIKWDEEMSLLSGNIVWKLFTLENGKNTIRSSNNNEISLGKNDPFKIPEYYVNFFTNITEEEEIKVEDKKNYINHKENKGNYTNYVQDALGSSVWDLDGNSYSFPFKN